MSTPTKSKHSNPKVIEIYKKASSYVGVDECGGGDVVVETDFP